MPLTETLIRKTRPLTKPLKLSDGGGLHLLVNVNGGRWWRFRYRIGGKEKMLSLGVYPDVPLKLARQRRDDARRLVSQGVDPSMERRAQKASRHQGASFEAVAREWHCQKSARWSAGYASSLSKWFEKDVFPLIGQLPVEEVTAQQLLALLRAVEARAAVSTAHRIGQLCGQVFRYAIATGRAKSDPSRDLRGALRPVRVSHRAAITEPERVGGLLRAIDTYPGQFVTRCALQLACLLFVRPGELRKAEWKEFDFLRSQWRIPAWRMKMRTQHTVPLSRQALQVLMALRPLTGDGRYVFPSIRSRLRPMSESTLNAALRRLDYEKEDMTSHGFRAMASTLLHEQGWSSDVIERQLAHIERNKIKAAYNHAGYLGERNRMMQEWADYLDWLRRAQKNAAPYTGSALQAMSPQAG
ncbi:integrase arm-type DNA-binding domain-containing protein [Stenotrophomonas sp. MMGLT7]|uniref:tyrosine-type recombinase/integrase n=1 Tax=Stenotrophomonas sp. MMGLT7 TaxID=2901227 RepID=UPI001E4697D8|nr:integrase arm-type DNA-binding domain-containing protein [Stenotrophomonas sp. MMGLT7]MCD7100064.1 tyrosine-type recombinase/integrase [Stenotrophomonas sp. MMGLT7]